MDRSYPLLATLLEKFQSLYGRAPEALAYAPGRVEVLGNHTDYNEGCVLSAAIDRGTFFATAATHDGGCRLTAGDLMRTLEFRIGRQQAVTSDRWANYCLGVFDLLQERYGTATFAHGFDAVFLSNLPLGSGLSSSAALEIATGLALAKLYGLTLEPMELARIAQEAEQRFAGVRCGLLDQISTLFGAEDLLVWSDFRTMEINHAPLGTGHRLLLCDSGVRHALVDGQYNERRAACEAAVTAFSKILPQRVSSLRDVSWSEWQRYQGAIDAHIARRAAHPIAEHERVLRGVKMLAQGDHVGFGGLLYESHASSRDYFENSCAEIDFLVDTARATPGVIGARLSGGGFGGSMVALVERDSVDNAIKNLTTAYKERFGRPCATRVTHPAAGAKVLRLES